MIVECDRCSTQFQLDESKVPARGIRVRCSSCKYSFHLRRPDASPEEAAEEIAAEAVTRGAAPSPEATRDLAAAEDEEAEGASEEDLDQEEAGAEGEETEEAEETEETEETDWEFNHDAPEDRGDQLSSNSDAPEHPAGPPVAGRSPGALDLTSDHESTDSEKTPDDGDSDSDGPFGSMDDFSRPRDGEESQEDAQVETESEPIGLSLESPRRDLPGAGWGEAASVDRAAEPAIELDRRAPSLPTQPVESSSERTRPRRASAPKMERAKPTGQQTEDGASSWAPIWLVRGGQAAGWLLTLGLLALGAFRGLMPVSLLPAPGPEMVVVAGLEAGEIEGRWVETARAGTVFSVTGRLHNAGSEHLPLQVVLLGDRGERLAGSVASIGVPLSESALRELSRAELIASRQQAASELAAFPPESGGSVRFQAIFEGVPDSAQRFRLEAAPTLP
jgi:predicted Zn finger-like uncharacterized protein